MCELAHLWKRFPSAPASSLISTQWGARQITKQPLRPHLLCLNSLIVPNTSCFGLLVYAPVNVYGLHKYSPDIKGRSSITASLSQFMNSPMNVALIMLRRREGRRRRERKGAGISHLSGRMEGRRGGRDREREWYREAGRETTDPKRLLAPQPYHNAFVYTLSHPASFMSTLHFFRGCLYFSRQMSTLASFISNMQNGLSPYPSQ